MAETNADVQGEIEAGLKFGRDRLDKGREFMPMLVLHCADGTIPVVLTRFGPGPTEQQQQLYQLGAVIGLAYGVESYVAITDARVREASMPAAEVEAFKASIPVGSLASDPQAFDAMAVAYVTPGGVIATGYQRYERQGRRVIYTGPTLKLDQRLWRHGWVAFFDGIKNAEMLGKVGGIAPSVARERARALLKQIERPAKDGGFSVIDPSRLTL